MLIPASKQKEVANAVNRAKNEEKYLDYVAKCDRALPTVRKRFEDAISEAAIDGRSQLRVLLGVYGGQYESKGLLHEVLSEIEGGSTYQGDWSRFTRESDQGSRAGRYIWASWNEMCCSLIEDLERNGYEVKVEHNKHYLSYDYEHEDLSLSPNVLANHFIVVSW